MAAAEADETLLLLLLLEMVAMEGETFRTRAFGFWQERDMLFNVRAACMAAALLA